MVEGGGESVASLLALTLIGIFAGEIIQGGIEIKDLFCTTQPKVVEYSWKYR